MNKVLIFFCIIAIILSFFVSNILHTRKINFCFENKKTEIKESKIECYNKMIEKRNYENAQYIFYVCNQRSINNVCG